MSSLPSFFLSPTAFRPVRSRPAEGTATAASGCPASNGVHDLQVTIQNPDIIRQMRKVFRMKAGDVFIALDGKGYEYVCVINHIDHTVVRALVEKRTPNTRETAVSLSLYPSLIRRERFATIVEKCTELGVASFVPIDAVRSPYHDISPHLRDRWEAIIRESVEVARRGMLPKLASITTLADVLVSIPSDELVVVLSTAQIEVKIAKDIATMIHGVKRIHIFLGPEGDYTEEEYGTLKARGAISFSLGARIVRSETAAIAAVALFTSFL